MAKEENLVIVESPAKAKTIEKFLGKNFSVKSSFGHIRDLVKKDFGIDINNNYKPRYEVSPDKKKIVTELKKDVKNATNVWLASDNDREGEAIAWHLFEVLKLKEDNTKRIVFHEITKSAIEKAIQNPLKIDQDLVNAQQARRILDRLVGFELSPVLWKKVKPSLSAGRVQSVAVRLIVEREREITAFKSLSSFKITALFSIGDEKNTLLKAELPQKFETKEQALVFLEKCKKATFKIGNIETKPAKKSPSPPFTTSTLQQEASRKLSFSVSQTMTLAQKLYEAGYITYMRTDSVTLSAEAVSSAKKEIISEFGNEYSYPRKYKTKIKNAQEAHEAIRPAYFNKPKLPASVSSGEKRLYELIWKRAIASQMADAQLEKTTVTINISTTTEKFIAKGEILKFDGFLKVYIESTDDENEEPSKILLPPLLVNQQLEKKSITATERFSHHPPRFTEATLVRKLEELGIGRPSTYAPIISTVQKRGYVIKEDREGTPRKYFHLILEDQKISETRKTEISGAERSKLFPTDVGMIVTDFLSQYFGNIMDYNFTASVEKEFDDIASGKLEWNRMIDNFYKPFHNTVEHTLENSQKSSGQRLLGTDPATSKPIYVRIGRYGPMAQIGETNTDKEAEKPKFAGLRKGQSIETITLEEVLDLFKLPRTLGNYENKTVVAAIGRFGPYIRHDSKFVSLKKLDDPLTIELDRAIELIELKREADRKKFIKSFDNDPEMSLLNGRWGAYISYKKKNYKIPKDQKAENLTYEDCLKIIKESGSKTKTKKRSKKQ